MRGELIALAVLATFFLGFLFVNSMGEHEWGGADGEAEGVISDLTGGTYQPWIVPVWEPPSVEIESLFFSLQAAIGGLIIGYFLGYHHRAKKAN
jgi:cobalt/nickel transport protein